MMRKNKFRVCGLIIACATLTACNGTGRGFGALLSGMGEDIQRMSEPKQRDNKVHVAKDEE